MSIILITGGTGLVGSALTNTLVEQGHQVIILSRTSKSSPDKNITYATWDIRIQTVDAEAIAKADYIFHLAGAGIADKRWTEARKEEITKSRIESSKLLIKGLSETSNKIKAVISASAIGWYGDDAKRSSKKRAFTEEVQADTGFLGNTCRLWEDSIEPVEKLGIRLVKLRLGIVLSKDGGALAEFIKPVRFGFAGVLGSGKQMISWIHIEDLCNLFIFAMKHEIMHGVYNAVAPTPVTNKTLTLTLAQKVKGRFFVPMHVPAFALKILLGEMSVEVLKSTTVSSDKVQGAGFAFLYPGIEEALSEIIK